MTILGSIAAVTPLAAQPDEGVITDIEQGINDVFTPVADAVTSVVFWGLPLGDYSFPLIVLWLVAAAAIFTVYFHGVQFRSLGTAWALVRGRYSRSSDPGEVTHFQALASAVSGTVGLGNIAGVAVAVTVGGPGATFWMILAGLLGMCTKFVECTLGVRYREIHEDGTVTGGPFTYMPVAFERFGASASKIGVSIFAVALILFGALGGNAFQSNQTYAQAVEITGGEEGFLGSPLASLLFG
ncbi:MAG: alanine:cation symporter family protein, partial [Nocardioides sp.]